MKINITNFEELILTLICICGEVKESYIIKKFEEGDSILKDYTYNYAKRTLHSMDKERKLINKKEYKNLSGCDKYLRLSAIAGDTACSQISAELFPHFELMAGDRNNRYKGTASTLRRKRDVMYLTLTHFLDGIMVDYFTLDYTPRSEDDYQGEYRKSVFTDNGKLLPPKEIIGRMENNDVCYFTSNVLRDVNNKAASIFKGKSQYTGILIGPPKFYICYYIPHHEYTWTGIEEQLKLIMTGFVQSLLGKEKTPAPAAIFYLPDEETYDAYLNPVKEKTGRGKGRRIYPPEIYNSGFLLPLEGTNYKLIRDLLLTEDGEKKITQVILGKNYIENAAYDGIIQGCKIYSLLLSDFCKMERIKEAVRREDSIIVIHSWQEKAVRKYFGEKTRIITVDEAEFENYYYEIQG